MNGLAAYGHWASPPPVGNIILAAHSGGGKAMRAVADFAYFQTKVREVWCFDCLYNTGDGDFWINWKKAPGHNLDRLWVYSTGKIKMPQDSTKPVGPDNPLVEKDGTFTNLATVQQKAAAQRLANVEVAIGRPYRNVVARNHDLVPATFLTMLIDTAACLA